MVKKLALAVILFLISSQLYAFDGNRKGFVLGGSGGVTIIDKLYSRGMIYESKPAFGFKYHIGYGFSNHHVVHVGLKINNYSLNDSFHFDASRYLTWNYFVFDQEKSMFTTFAVQVSDLEETFSGNFNIILGVGYEFYEHLMIELLYINDVELNNFRDVSLLFSYYAY